MYRHGLRVSEATSLPLKNLYLKEGKIWIQRLKNGLSTMQNLQGDEMRAIRRYLATRDDNLPWLFLSNQEQEMTRQTVRAMLLAAAKAAGLPPVHPHMLRHSCGFTLGDKNNDERAVQDYLGHRNPRHTARYTRTAASRFEGLWD